MRRREEERVDGDEGRSNWNKKERRKENRRRWIRNHKAGGEGEEKNRTEEMKEWLIRELRKKEWLKKTKWKEVK